MTHPDAAQRPFPLLFLVSRLRRTLGLALLITSAVTSADSYAQSDSSTDKTVPLNLKAGAFAADITPPRFPISVNGNMTDKKATGAADPLHARCLVLDDGRTAVGFVIVDSCVIPRTLMDAARVKAAYRTDLPAPNILIAATHAHSCPAVTAVFQSEPDTDYSTFLVDRIAEGLERAWNQRVPAEVGWASAENRNQLFNRRWKLKDGVLGENPFGQKVDRVKMNPGLNNPEVTESIGLIDPEVSLLAVRNRENHEVIGLLANYSLHYVGGVPGELVSGDYFAEFAQRLTRMVGPNPSGAPYVAIMSNGTSGDVNNVNFALKAAIPRKPFEQIALVAEDVAQTAFSAYQTIQFRSDVTIDSLETELELKVRIPTAEDVAKAKEVLKDAAPDALLQGMKAVYARETLLLSKYPETVPARLQAIRIGDLAILSSPCETFTETGLALKAASPFDATFTIELANGYNGYLPTPEQHALGGYETWRARSSYLAVDAEPQVRAALTGLLKQLKDRAGTLP